MVAPYVLFGLKEKKETGKKTAEQIVHALYALKYLKIGGGLKKRMKKITHLIFY